jgi:hypothetical protein
MLEVSICASAVTVLHFSNLTVFVDFVLFSELCAACPRDVLK